MHPFRWHRHNTYCSWWKKHSIKRELFSFAIAFIRAAVWNSPQHYAQMQRTVRFWGYKIKRSESDRSAQSDEFSFLLITELNVSGSEKLPEMDSSYLGGGGYAAVSELMRAMILRTIEDLQSGSELRDEALAYLNSDEDEYILSFVSICRYFGFDPVKTRHAILNAKSRIRTRRRAA